VPVKKHPLSPTHTQTKSTIVKQKRENTSEEQLHDTPAAFSIALGRSYLFCLFVLQSEKKKRRGGIRHTCGGDGTTATKHAHPHTHGHSLDEGREEMKSTLERVYICMYVCVVVLFLCVEAIFLLFFFLGGDSASCA
jgi:hypothetical protein